MVSMLSDVPITRHFRDELLTIPDLRERARRVRALKKETSDELMQIQLRLARDMAAAGLSMAAIGEAFGVTRARAHQMVHQRASGRAPAKQAS